MDHRRLEELYSNPRLSSAFGGVERLYAKAKEEDDKVKREQIENFLIKQNSYSLYKPSRIKYKTPKTWAIAKNEYYQADLADLTKYKKENDGYGWILALIDVKTRYLRLFPLKNKKPDSVADVLEKLFMEGHVPAVFHSDRGSEFKGSVKNLLSVFGVEQLHTDGPAKSSLIERVFKDLKVKISRYMEFSKGTRYIDKLQDFAEAYNDSFHRTIGRKPHDAYFSEEKNDRNERIEPPKYKSKFQVGDHVRISYNGFKFKRGYHEGWTRELFTIYQIRSLNKVHSYYLQTIGETPEKLQGAFFKEELSKANKPEFFEIEKILKTYGTKKGQRRFLVKFLGYPSSENAIVEEKDLKDI